MTKTIDIETFRMFNNVLPKLKKISKKLNLLDCASCNGTIEETKYDKKVEKLLLEAQGIAGLFDFVAFHQTDPRGASLYLIDETMNETNYNNGICIF